MDSRRDRALDRRAAAAQRPLEVKPDVRKAAPDWLGAIGADLVAWFALPAAFLYAYVKGYGAPTQAILPHLQVALLALLALALLRLTLSRALSARAGRLAAALAASAALWVMIAYYGLALIGLEYWGRVISWDLIASYAAQAPRLAETLEISWPGVLGIAALAYAALTWIVHRYLRRVDSAALIGARLSWSMLALLVVAGTLFLAVEVYQFRAAPPTGDAEPVSLTFYPVEGGLVFQSHAVDKLGAARRDADEDAVRAAYAPSLAPDRRNVVLIVVDALRADHMGIYGYARDTTPHLARLEKAGVLRKAPAVQASCSSSVCGLLSIASSRFVHQFSRRPITLPEVLKRYGYRIHMILSGNHTLFYGLRDAYGDVDSYFDAYPARAGEYMNDDAIVVDHLSRFPAWDGNPVMMQFHLMSAHALGHRDPGLAKYQPAANYSLFALTGKAGRSSDAINHYDNGVLQADATIDAILGALRQKGYLRDAIVAITADHGEALGEHGSYTHAQGVHDETLNIPFVLLSYGHRPAAPIDGAPIASQVDIAPTVLAELGIAAPASWRGMALQRPLKRDFLHFQERWDLGIFDLRDPGNPWKYWSNVRTGEEYAFNLRLDPRQRRNRIAAASEQQRRDWRLQVLAASAALN